MSLRRYHPATQTALLRHIVEQRGFIHTYLLSHPRISNDSVEAILDDLYVEARRRDSWTGAASGD